jgi:hypothetical protein
MDRRTGLLPPGRYPATIADLYQRFVLEAPAAGFRNDTFLAGQVWLNRAADIFGPGHAWIDGGFTTWKTDIPHDMDIAYIPLDYSRAEAALSGSDGWGLRTLQSVFYLHPEPGGHLLRLQPMGGMVDGFLIDPGVPEDLIQWHNIWSAVKGRDGRIIPGLEKGYVEVSVP